MSVSGSGLYALHSIDVVVAIKTKVVTYSSSNSNRFWCSKQFSGGFEVTRLFRFDMGRLFRYGKGLHKDVSEMILQAILIITVWKKVLAGFTASFLVIRNATVVNLSNNLAMSNVWIVFTFKRRFRRR